MWRKASNLRNLLTKSVASEDMTLAYIRERLEEAVWRTENEKKNDVSKNFPKIL